MKILNATLSPKQLNTRVKVKINYCLKIKELKLTELIINNKMNNNQMINLFLIFICSNTNTRFNISNQGSIFIKKILAKNLKKI